MPPYLAFSSLDKKSVRYTIPLSTIRRVERLNARAGVYALSLSTWHGMKIVSFGITEMEKELICSVDRTTYIFAPNCRSVLLTITRRTEDRTPTRSNEACEEFRQDMLF
jgi:hypothetical protein